VFNLVDDHWVVYIVAREAVEKWGDLNDWKHQIGTGPFILDDYVSGSSLSLHKNPDYWAQDFVHPENKMPYLDNVKVLIIPDLATALAALRTGKIDLIEGINWQQAKSIAKTNPELLQVSRPTVAFGIVMQVDRKPYSDIKVRQAMQKAIDIQSLAQSYYGGLAQGKPMGIVGTQGYYTPYDQWPADVKAGYTYDPAAAKKLLADAGYPNGFKATITTNNANDLDLLQILKSYLSEVGINLDIQAMDPVSYTAYKQAGKTELAFDWCTVNFPPVICLNMCYSGSPVYYSSRHISDPTFDGLWTQAKASFDQEEQRRLVNEADMRAITQQWLINTPSAPLFCIYQPWLMRFNGETRVPQRLSPYLWIDQKLKTSMGR
jgi:peptide/nickel transport system substrate-binding protein